MTRRSQRPTIKALLGAVASVLMAGSLAVSCSNKGGESQVSPCTSEVSCGSKCSVIGTCGTGQYCGAGQRVHGRLRARRHALRRDQDV
jgi:hypothetical protein